MIGRLLALPAPVRWVATLLAVAAAVWWLTDRGPDTAGVDWVEVRRDDLRLEAEASGTLKAVETIELGPPQVSEIWNYKIARLATEGSQVKAGEPVLGFDTSELDRKLEEKRAEADAAQKEIEKKQIDMTLQRRDEDLRLAETEARFTRAKLKIDVPEEILAGNELQTQRIELQLAEKEMDYLEAKMQSQRRAADAEIASLRERRDRASSRVREIEDALERMTVRAPRPGTVVFVTGWRDEKKKVGDAVWRGEKVLEIPSLDEMKAVGEVDEADAGRIGTGQTVRLRLDAHPDLEYSGRVESIWGTVQRKSGNSPLKVVRFDVALDRTDTERMRPGMRFTGAVETGRIPGALLVPADAIFPTSDGPVAYRKTAFGFEKVRLDIGRRTADSVEVLSGLAAGDRISRSDLGAERGRS